MRVIARVAIGTICKVVGQRDIRYRWLAHFLLGSGQDMELPTEVVQESLTREDAVQFAGEPFKFDSAHRLFWLVGTMTFHLDQVEGGVHVVGVDRYDWHPNRFLCPECGAWGYDIIDGVCDYCGTDATGDWWWSPTSLPGWVAKALRAIWPACRPYVEVGECGRLAVSNGFWPWLGGTEFDSVLDVPLGILPSWRDDGR